MSKTVSRRLICGLVLATAVACSKPTAQEHVAKADAYMAESKVAEAIVEYRSAIQVDPMHGDARAKLAEIYLKQKDVRNALDQYVRAADLLPDNAEVQVKAGSLLMLARRYDDAKVRAEKALAINRQNVEAQILLGSSLAGLNDLDGAIQQLQAAIALSPTQDNVHMSLGAVENLRGNAVESEKAFRRAVDVAPRSVNARMALANFLWNANRTAEAEDALKAALTIEPGNIVANRALGTLYLSTKRAAEAEPFFKAVAAGSDTTETKLALADYYLVVERFDDATRVLNELAAVDATYAAASTRLAAIKAQQDNRAGALVQLREVLEKHPKEAPARLLLARVLLSDNKRDEAMAEATRITVDTPEAPAAADAFFMIGRLHQTTDRLTDAIAAYEEVLKRQPRPVAATVSLAGAYLTLGEFDRATTYAQQALSLVPDLPDARALLVRINIARGDMDQARQGLASLRKQYPNSPTVMNLLAAQQAADRQYDAARTSYARSAALMPNDLEALAGLVQVDLAAGRTQQAVERVEATLKRGKPSASMLALAARAYGAAGKIDQAEAMLKQAIDTEPARLQAYGMLAGLYISQRRIPEAKAQFERLITLNPKSVPSQTMLGMLLDYEKKTEEAIAQYQKVLTIDASAPVAANNLAWIYVANNRNMDQALELARTAQRGLPDEPNVNDTLGWIYYKRDLNTEAIRHLEIAARNGPGEPGTHYHLGMAYMKAGDIAKARASLKKALSINTTFEGAAEAKQTLATIGG